MTTNLISTRSAPHRSRLPIIWIGALVLCTLGYQPVHAADETSSRSWLEQAKQFEQAQRYGDAITIYRTILQRDLENDDIRAALAKLLSWQGAHAEAAELYREIIQRHPLLD